ncbi:MAG: hypothetical protein V4592_22415 [Bacteroidota bacterium]
MNVRLLIIAAAYHFFLEKKVTKIQDSKNASFAHMAFALQTGQNHGYAYLPRCHSHNLRFCKTLMPSLAQATMFCPLSPGSSFAVGELKTKPARVMIAWL